MLLIDAYNVLLVPGVLPPRLAGLELDGLIRLLGISRYARQRIVLVCDGEPRGFRPDFVSSTARVVASSAGEARSSPTRKPADLRVVYAGSDRDADSVIEDMLERDSAARRWTVVSGDRRIQRAAARARASSLSSEAFLRQLAFDESRPLPTLDPTLRDRIPLGRSDVEDWMREFQIEAGEAPALRAAPRVEPVMPPPVPSSFQHLSAGAIPRHTPQQRAASAGTSKLPQNPAKPVEVDPVLRELLREIPGIIRLEDLDMSRWLDTDPPG
ncbi:MAG: NYN domain-containing protein [Phycisphaerales bacterium]|nr:NYN domain-containing protein [Phycisphaerales bacterium]